MQSSDDLSESNFLQAMLPAFEDEKVKLAFCASQVIDEKGNERGEYRNGDYLTSLSTTKWQENYRVSAEQEVADGLGIKNTILNISSAVFRRFGVPDDFRRELSAMHVGGDWYLILNAIRGGEVSYEARPLNSHRRHSESIVGKVLSGQGDARLREFFHDYAVNVRYVADTYRLDPDYAARLRKYELELWHTLAPGRPDEELDEYLSLDEVKEKSGVS